MEEKRNNHVLVTILPEFPLLIHIQNIFYQQIGNEHAVQAKLFM